MRPTSGLRSFRLAVLLIATSCSEPQRPSVPPTQPEAPPAPVETPRCKLEVPTSSPLGSYWASEDGSDVFLMTKRYVSISTFTAQSMRAPCEHSDFGRIDSVVAFRWRQVAERIEFHDGCAGWIHLASVESDGALAVLVPMAGVSGRALETYHRLDAQQIDRGTRDVFEYCLPTQFY